jgi:hypothetical protein
MHRDRRDVGKAHQTQKKTAEPKSETNELATRKINTINSKQTPPVQVVLKDIWIYAIQLWERLQFQHRNPPALLIKNLSYILKAP